MARKRVDVYYHTDSAESKGKLVDCALCKGSGRDHTNSLIGVKCSACGGKGKVRI